MARKSAADVTEDNSSEYSWGPGLRPHVDSAGSPSPVSGGPANPVLNEYDHLRATRLTDSANPDASEDDVFSPNVTFSGTNDDGTYKPGTLRPGVTQPVSPQAVPELPSVGQHGRIDPGRYNPGHEPDGYQDGSGREWRDSVPPNPVL